MSDEETFERVKNTLVNCVGFPSNLVTAEVNLKGIGGDSLDAVELMILLEEEFNIEMKDDDFNEDTPISEIVSTVKERVNGRNRTQ